MAGLSLFAIGAGLAVLTSAQSASSSSSVTSIFFPLADQQPLLGSIVGGNSDAQTIVVQCDPSASSDECGFPTPITITAGPSTVHYQPTGIYEALGELDCKITGTTEAVCSLTAGIYDTASLETATDFDITTSAASSSTTTATATGTDLSDNWMLVTITGGEVQTGSSSTSMASGATKTSTASSSSRTGNTSGSSSASVTSTASGASASSTTNVAASMTFSGALIGMAMATLLLL